MWLKYQKTCIFNKYIKYCVEERKTTEKVWSVGWDRKKALDKKMGEVVRWSDGLDVRVTEQSLFLPGLSDLGTDQL